MDRAHEGFDLVAVLLEFLLVHVEQQDAIRNADDNDQRSQQAGQDGDLVPEEDKRTERPDDPEYHHDHREEHGLHAAEEQHEDQSRDQQRERDEDLHLSGDLLGHRGTDIGQPGIMEGQTVVHCELIRHFLDLPDDPDAIFGVELLLIERDRHQGRVRFRIEEQTFVKWQSTEQFMQAVDLRLGPGSCGNDRFEVQLL